jgi:DNA helicase-2/ATP-dependent DNA helicase PcrA
VIDRYAAVRARAQAVLSEYAIVTGSPVVRGTHPALSLLEDIADRCFQLAVVEDDELPTGTVGQLDLELDTISYRPGLDSGRRAFTVAHEIGHRALEHPERHIIDTEVDIDESPDHDSLTVHNGVYRSYSSRSAYELEANVFAIELLAPVEEVRRYLLDRREWTIEEVAAYFGVSKAAMLNQIPAALRPLAVPHARAGGQPKLEDDKDHDLAVSVPGPALVLAGPGAGKTRILVRRFQRLVAEGIDPRRILALTFSNKAAAEMRERLSLAMPDQAHALEVYTFHSFGLEILRLHHRQLGLATEPRLLTPAELMTVLKVKLCELPMGCFEDLRNPARNLGLVLDASSRAKDELINPTEFLQLANDQGAAASNDEETEAARRAVDAGRFYEAYEALLRDKSSMDYGDLIVKTVQLLERTTVGHEIANSFSHILVDEFQDINYASGRMVKALSQAGAEVWAVGDLRQSIYRFRGASPSNIAAFAVDYPGAQVVTLSTNYRSVSDIVACGRAVEIPMREDASMLPTAVLQSRRGPSQHGPGVRLTTSTDVDCELSALANEVKLATARYGAPSVAVLCRTRAGAQRVSDALEQAGILTNWSGDLINSTTFKDIVGILYLAAGDLRGLVRTAGSREHRISEQDLEALLAYAGENGPSTYALMDAAIDAEVIGLSPEGRESLSRLKDICGELCAQPTVMHAIAEYLFVHSTTCRDLLAETSPSARRQLTSIRQILSLSRGFCSEPDLSGHERIRAFLEFVEACVESGKFESVTPELGDASTVTVMTVHGSKGLEWSAVFVPFLADRKFPNRTWHEPIPIPTGLIRGYDPADEESEEACLFYVAVTRARDKLYLSFAEQYGRKAKPSPFLNPVLEALRPTNYVEELSVTGEQIKREEPTMTVGSRFAFQGVVPLSPLKLFQRCPKRFEFTFIQRLSAGDKGYRDFQRVLSRVQHWLCDEGKRGTVPSIDHVLVELDAAWEEMGPANHWYAPRYRARVDEILRRLHQRLVAGASLRLREVVEIDCDGRMVGLTLDEIADGSEPIIRWIHYGRKAKRHLGKDATEHMPALLGAAAAVLYPTRNPEVRISYPLLDEEFPSEATATIIKNRLKKVREIAEQAEAGPYPAKWNDHTCLSCPFALICPAADEDDSDS